VRPLDFPLLADENIPADVVQALVASGKDARSVFDEGFVGRDDVDILRAAHAQGRVVLTHDSDFGTLAYRTGEPFTGIVYLRPGHIAAKFVLEILSAIEVADLDVKPPFLIVAERKEDAVRIRARTGPWT
jgi:predicted nuclease of predicted toxin-antitoxin system